MSWDNIITLSSDTESRSGLYAVDLPGVTLNLFDDLTKDEQDDFNDCWSSIYNRAKNNFIKDVQGRLADKFHIDRKLVSRETSKFQTSENTYSGYAGINLVYSMPKYAKIRVVSISVNALTSISDFVIKFYEDDTSGTLLYSKTVDLDAGQNTINIDQDFEVIDTLFVGYDAASFSLYKTENKYYANTLYSFFNDISCSFPCWGGQFNGGVTQVNGGGVNVKAVIFCSIEKFILENINLFNLAFWYRVGVEIMKERITSDRFNRFTTLDKDRAVELMSVYMDEYTNEGKTGHLDLSVKNLRIQEDPICFECQSPVSSAQLLP
jgi:hypothetical protein